ncbi:MAG: zinc ribbon domain-containing protein [Clostridia bacterium]|nr:zinc ribbon domain-containing protein [Clostridia bacterium]
MAQKFCTECGARLPENSLFCAECGTPIISAGKPASSVETKPASVGDAVPVVIPGGISYPVAGQANIPTKMGKMSPVDESLTMLAEYCSKTMATVGGDGYTEWVLNRCADGTLQLDYYRNYVGYEEEVHETFPAPADTWDRILSIKEKYHLANPPSWLNMGMCGGERIVKIREGDTVIRLVWGSLNDSYNKAFSLIKEILTGIGSKKQ